MRSGLGLRDLTIGHGTVPLATAITLDVPRGTITAILGPSGIGKSTLLATIAGIQPPLAGTITLDGADLAKVPVHRRGVGLVFQEPLLFTHLDVAGNIAYGLRRSGMSSASARERAEEFAGWLGLAGLESRRWDELSGGQAQRVALARALAPEPSVLCLDEPFSALDSELRTRLVVEVRELVRERGIAAVHVTHDRAEAIAIADEILEFRDGAVHRP